MTSHVPVRRAAFAGRWYPGQPDELVSAVDRYLAAGSPMAGHIHALVSPHAGLMYSGPIAGIGYAAVRQQPYDVTVLIGPSHYVAFPGVAVADRGAFDSPVGRLVIDEAVADRLLAGNGVVHRDAGVHAREHSLELQLPFLARALPTTPIVPLLMGSQHRAIVDALSAGLLTALAGRRALLVASSDLSHFHPRPDAARLDALVLRHLDGFDADGLQEALERDPDLACGGGPIVTVLRVARGLGAETGRVLRYGDSGDASGDVSQVVGYVSAAFGTFA